MKYVEIYMLDGSKAYGLSHPMYDEGSGIHRYVGADGRKMLVDMCDVAWASTEQDDKVPKACLNDTAEWTKGKSGVDIACELIRTRQFSNREIDEVLRRLGICEKSSLQTLMNTV